MCLGGVQGVCVKDVCVSRVVSGGVFPGGGGCPGGVCPGKREMSREGCVWGVYTPTSKATHLRPRGTPPVDRRNDTSP